MFMGTPHSGSKIASWPATLAKIVNAMTLTKSIRLDLLKSLENNADELKSLSRQSIQRLVPLHIYTCVEQNFIPPLSSVVS